MNRFNFIEKPPGDDRTIFGDVKFVCISENPDRMEVLAYYISNYLISRNYFLTNESNFAIKSLRYTMFKAGPVLCMGKGTGLPSLSVVLCEALNLMRRAGAHRPTFLLLASCGGLAVPPGSVVVTRGCVNGLLCPFEEMIVNKEKFKCSNLMDLFVYKDLKRIALRCLTSRTVFFGRSLCAYELLQAGVLNVVVMDHFKEGKINYPPVILEAWHSKLIYVASMYIREEIEGKLL